MLTPTGVTMADYIAAVKNDAPCHVRMTFTEQGTVFTDDDIEQSGTSITSVLNGDTNLTFGKAVMATMHTSLFISGKTMQLVWDKEFKLEVGLEVGNSTEWTTIGYFSGERPEKLSSMGLIDFTAKDRMHKFDILADDWLKNLTYPKTLKQLYDSLCAFVGIQNESGDELSAIMSRSFSSAPIVASGLLCRDILAFIAEAAGCYAKITPGGKCKLVWFTDHTSDYSLAGKDEFTDDAYGIGFSDESLTWEDLEGYTWEEMEQLRWSEIDYYYQQMHIHALTVKQTEDDIGVTVPSNAGNVTTYMIVDNPFLVHSTDAEVTAYIQPIFNRLDAFGGYLPMNMSCVGNPLIEAGDIINVEVRGEIVALPIFYKTMLCTASCTDNYEATGKVNQEHVSYENREKLSQGGRMHIFRNDIDELYSEIFDNNGNSKIAQNAAGIQLLAEEKARVFYSANAPTGSQSDPLVEGYLWIDTAHNNTLYRYNGSAWVDASFDDPDKTRVFSAASAPSSTQSYQLKTGDLWIDTANNNTLYRYNGSAWVDASFDDPEKSRVFYSGSTPTGTQSDPLKAGDLWIDSANNNALKRYNGSSWSSVSYSDPNKYTVRSGIDIKAAGVEVTGGKYVKIISGGTFDVDATNFKISSTNKNVISGNWTFDDTGATYSDTTKQFCMGSYKTGKETFTGIQFLSDNQYAAYLKLYGGMRRTVSSSSYLTNHLLVSFNGEFLGGGTSFASVLVAPNDENSLLGGSDHYWGYAYIRHIYGTLHSSSSKHSKHNIKELLSVGDVLDKLRPVSFVYNYDKEEHKHFGLIHEDTIDVLPEICQGDKDAKPEEKAINYIDLVPLLLKEIQGLRKRVATLEDKVNELERK